MLVALNGVSLQRGTIVIEVASDESTSRRFETDSGVILVVEIGSSADTSLVSHDEELADYVDFGDESNCS